jgi:anaerobic magnesium-protoporphyrin IX monomethyl ester cyclase
MLDLSKMKNILIVNSLSDNGKIIGRVMWGAWAVSSYLKTAVKNSDVIFLDANYEDDFFKKFKEIVKTRDTIGFSVTSMQIKYTLPLIKYIKENYPRIKVIVGGIHPILYPNQDYGDLIDEVVDYELPKDIFLYELLPEKQKEYFKKKAEVITGFNCSYKCAFCVNSVRNCHYEGVPLEKILYHLDYVVKEFNPRLIYFRDEDFFQDIDKARAIIEHIIKRGYKFGWDAASRVTNFRQGRIDNELLEKIVKSGCRQLKFGVESGSQNILNYLKKGQTVEQIKTAVKQCVKYGIMADCSMIIGLPGETKADREETYRLIDKLHKYGPLVDIFGPQVYRPYPGGSLFEEVKKFGYEFPDNFVGWEHFYDNNPLGAVFDTKINYPWLTSKENKTLPFVWVVVHYGLNYSQSDNIFKKIIGKLFKIHWYLRWFGGWDLKLFVFIRKKALK